MSRQAAIELYRTTYNHDPEWVAAAPGRINLIGEHTDYSEGFVFPAAIDRELWVAAGPSQSGQTELASREKGIGASFSHAALTPQSAPEGWAKYPAGVAWALRAKTPILAAVASELPDESGVSSSAAIELAFAVIWNHVEELGLPNKELALLGQSAEKDYVGMPCGVMDQMASAMGRSGCAMFLDTRSLEITYAPIPDGVTIVLCNTGKKRQLTGGEYKERRTQCESAAQKLGVPFLRDASLADLDAADLTHLEESRAYHVITENQRCLDFAEALMQGELDKAGRLMEESHTSLRYNFEVSVRELNAMAGAARRSPGCIGARLTGAGFGGAVVALVHSSHLERFIEGALAAYSAACPTMQPNQIACLASDGARLVAR